MTESVAALEPPYPADTRAKGWRFELDLERVMQSDTWALAAPELRPWLLMLWTVAWQQVPCGSMPSEEALIAARLGMKEAVFKKSKTILMRGWKLANDGRLYHETITERVVEMLGRKEADRKRKAEYRARMDAERKALESAGVPKLSHGTNVGQTEDINGTSKGQTSDSYRNDSTGTGTGTGTGFIKTENLSVPDGTGAEAPTDSGSMTKDELWSAGKSLLEQSGMPAKQCGTFVGKLVKDYDAETVMDAVRRAVLERPADPASFLKATCQHIAGERAGKNAKPSRHGGFDQIDYREGVAPDGSF